MKLNLHILDIMMFSTGPEFDRTVEASFNDILVKSTPSISRILSIFFSKRLAADALFTFSMKMPCEWNEIEIVERFVRTSHKILFTSFCSSVNVKPMSDSFGTLNCILKLKRKLFRDASLWHPIADFKLTTFGFL